MENALKVAEVIGPALVILGLSMLLYAKAWKQLLEKWEKDHYLLFPVMGIELLGGLVIVSMYNVWEWNIWLLVTLVGWAMILESVFYFLAPGSAIKSVILSKNTDGVTYFCAIVGLIVGAVLSYYAYLV